MWETGFGFVSETLAAIGRASLTALANHRFKKYMWETGFEPA